jgi:hypothetical protein
MGAKQSTWFSAIRGCKKERRESASESGVWFIFGGLFSFTYTLPSTAFGAYFLV